MERVDIVVDNLMKRTEWGRKAEDGRIWLKWSAIVGERLAEQTTPHFLKEGKLYVRVSSSPWLHELSYVREDVMACVNEVLGERLVTKVIFVIGASGRQR